MCRILLSIKPEYANPILEGKKHYEYRKVLCRKKVSGIVIYSSAPVMKVVGEASVKRTIVCPPEEMWNQTKTTAGIDKKTFDEYYYGHDTAVAFELCDVKKFEIPLDLDSYNLSCAPQSFVYL
jgi:predicted transcriptional regulator